MQYMKWILNEEPKIGNERKITTKQVHKSAAAYFIRRPINLFYKWNFPCCIQNLM